MSDWVSFITTEGEPLLVNERSGLVIEAVQRKEGVCRLFAVSGGKWEVRLDLQDFALMVEARIAQ